MSARLLASRGARRTSVVRAVGTFGLAGLIGLLVLGAGSVVASRHASTDVAMRDAARDAQVVGRAAVEPSLSDGLLTGQPDAVDRLDQEVRTRVLDSDLVRVKIWRPDGRIIYSDESRLIGSTYALGADEQNALRSGGVAADVSDLSRPENRFERPLHKLLEVYLTIHTPSGAPVLFEAYYRYDTVSSGAARLWGEYAPIMLGSLLGLELLQIPLAWSMARRLRAGQERQEQLLRRAIEATDIERRQIASDLHDGVVQDLAGVSYALAALEGHTDPETSSVIAKAAASTRGSIRALRSLLVEIYPPSLRDEGLAAALSDLVSPLSGRGLEVNTNLASDLQFGPEVEALLYRVAQEALRNVVNHAGATRVDIGLTRSDHRAVLEVVDDGRGFDTAAAPAPDANRHFGLRLLADLAAAAGGTFDVQSRPGHGTSLRLEVPTT